MSASDLFAFGFLMVMMGAVIGFGIGYAAGTRSRAGGESVK